MPPLIENFHYQNFSIFIRHNPPLNSNLLSRRDPEIQQIFQHSLAGDLITSPEWLITPKVPNECFWVEISFRCFVSWDRLLSGGGFYAEKNILLMLLS
ncbi:hypothetical protein CEXT_755311 [Caerostris extrusa]|uniref:Uncharacterized protein n=1 Tax=Caerostris extrusa TaxID=172846 RepID=A0AAV4PU26_CAEEX|nr:hypothetical protein CEXT_755311 [Caerostris extrusa]